MISHNDLIRRWMTISFTNPIISGACEIISIINDAGYDAYIVGGAVRDFILEVEIHDADITTNCPESMIRNLFDCYDIGKSKDFGIVSINHNSVSYEIAQFRSKDEKEFPTLDDDLACRDFTINSMVMCASGELIDKYNGYGDIKKRVIKTVGDPSDTFTDDYLRIMRAIRFSSRFEFFIDFTVIKGIIDFSKEIRNVSIERIKGEIWKMASLSGYCFADSLIKLDMYGILEVILPEVSAMRMVKETSMYHPEAYLSGDGSVFYHVIEALRSNKIEDPVINMAILLHDIGKPLTCKKKGYNYTYYGHAEAGKDIIEKMSRRFRFSNEEKNHFVFVSMNHMKLFRGEEMKPSKIVRMVNHQSWEVLKQVSYCDDACRIGMFDKDKFDKAIERMENIASEWSEKTNRDIKIIDGNTVMEITGLEPGRKIGRIIRMASEYCIDNNISETKDIEKVIGMVYSMDKNNSNGVI